MFWLVLRSSESNLKLLHRWPWRLVRPWMPGMEHEAGRWSTLLEQGRRDGSADRTTRRKEASIWASTAPPMLSFPWRSLNPLALLSHPLQCKHQQKLLLPSPWLRQIRPPPPPLLVLLLMLPWLPREAKLSDIPPPDVSEVQEWFQDEVKGFTLSSFVQLDSDRAFSTTARKLLSLLLNALVFEFQALGKKP